MKKAIYIFLPIILISLLAFSKYRAVSQHFTMLDDKVNKSYKLLLEEIENRNDYFRNFINIDSLSKIDPMIRDYFQSEESSINHVVSLHNLDLEYYFDSLLTQYVEKRKLLEPELEVAKKKYDDLLFTKVVNYNTTLKEYYQYDLFPRSIVGNRLGIKKRMYFDLKFGKSIERPSKKFVRTARKVDSILIDGL